MINRIILSSNYSPWSPYSGGGQRSTHHLAEALSNSGYDVHVIFTKTHFEDISPPTDLNYQLHWAEFPGIKSNRKNWFRGNSSKAVAKLVAALMKPGTIYHSNGEESSEIRRVKSDHPFPFVLTPRYPNIPVEVANIEIDSTEAWKHPSISKYVSLGQSLKQCDIYCPTSKFAASLYREVYEIADKPFDIVPNGIPEEFINIDTNEEIAPINRVIFFGRLSHEKGIRTLLDAASSIPENIDELVIIGRGELKPMIDEANLIGPLSGKIKRFEWLNIPDLIQEIKHSTIAVLPSFEESFGNAIVEAMACGIPVITTTAGSIPEIINDSENGLLIQPGNHRQLAESIKLLLSDAPLREKLRINGRSEVIHKYSWKATAEKYIQIYSDLLEGHIR